MIGGVGRAAALALALLLGACAGSGTEALDAGRPPVAAAPAEPQFTGDHFIADDGTALPLRQWLPEGRVKAVVLALHGFNDYSRAFEIPAPAWAADGIATVAYDQRGFGAGPSPGSWAGTRRLDADAAEAAGILHRRYPGVPLFLLGESMGGAVVITAVTGAAGAPRPDCDGIILVAPAVWGRSTMSVFERVALWGAYEVIPDMTFTGQGLHVQASDNIPMLRALGRDPLFIKATRVAAIKGLVDLMDAALAAAPQMTVPSLLLYGGRDEVIPEEPTKLFIEHLPPAGPASRRVAWYPDGYHMLLRDLEGPVVMRDVESWIADRAGPLPSGADRGKGQMAAAGG